MGHWIFKTLQESISSSGHSMCCKRNKFLQMWETIWYISPLCIPGDTSVLGRGGGLEISSSLEAKFGARSRSSQVHQIRGKLGKFCYHKMQKLGKDPNFGVISEIQRAKFRVFVTYMFGGKIWGSSKNFRGRFGAKPPDLLIYGSAPWVMYASFGLKKPRVLL